MISNWNTDIVVCTNGKEILSSQEKDVLAKKQIRVVEDEILRLQEENGHLKSIHFKNGKELQREAGFVSFKLQQIVSFEDLDLEMNDMGGIKTDPYGRTNVKGVYASGDNAAGLPQLVIAASEGSKAAIGVITDLVEETFGI